MASDGNAPYMECLLKVDPSPGWQMSVTVALASFHDSVFELNSSSGYIYVKGKTEPENILLKLMKADKHASILWSHYGPARDVQYQAQDSGSGYNHWKGHDPFSYAKGPYETYHQLGHHYHSYYTDRLAQGAINHMQHALEYEPRGHSERSSSVHSHNHHCPVHSHRRPCPVHSNHHHTPPEDSSLPSKQSEANGQVIDQPTSDKPAIDQPTSDKPAIDHCPVHSHRRPCPVHSNHHHTPPEDSSLPSKQSEANGQVIDQPTSDKPAIDQPTSDKPVIDQPTSDKPYRKGGFFNKVIGRFCSSC